MCVLREYRMGELHGKSREVCSVRRINTNTPLQALTTLNDTVYAEAAIALAEKQFFNSDSDVGQILLKVYQIAIGEKPSSKTLDALKRLYMQSLIYYRDHPEYVRNRILHSTPSPEKAALSIVCNAILNLDAFITKS